MHLKNIFHLFLLAIMAFTCLGGLLFPFFAIAADSDFPLRDKYQDVPIISAEDFARQLPELQVVDTRSQFEYDILHVEGAISIPMSENLFILNLQDEVSMDKTTVFYCNGYTCSKSYRAASAARQNGFRNVFVFDLGIYDWARQYPEHTIFRGKILADPARLEAVLAESEKHLLSFAAFKKKSAEKNSIVIDAREPDERHDRDGNYLSLPGIEGVVHQVKIDLLQSYVRNSLFQDLSEGKTLLIFDNSGRQAQWLSLYLKEHGFSSFYFLKGGFYNIVKDV